MATQTQTQINKQITKVNTKVNVKCPPCGKKRVKKPCVKKKLKSCLVLDEICGQIKQKCGGDPVVYWQSSGIHPSGSIRISNEGVCTMYVHIELDSGKLIRKSVAPSQQISFTALGLSRLTVKCFGKENTMCTGTYVLRLHYRVKS